MNQRNTQKLSMIGVQITPAFHQSLRDASLEHGMTLRQFAISAFKQKLRDLAMVDSTQAQQRQDAA